MDKRYTVRYEADKDDEYVDTLLDAEEVGRYEDVAIYAPGQTPGVDKPIAIWRDGEPLSE